MQQHGVTATELEQYVNALVSSSAQQAAAMDTMAHADMLELTMESLTNGLVLNSNQQAHDVRLFLRTKLKARRKAVFICKCFAIRVIVDLITLCLVFVCRPLPCFSLPSL